MPWACYLYPTTDQHLKTVLDHNGDDFRSAGAVRENKWVHFARHSQKIKKLASFILHNRDKMKFRIQNVDTVFYCCEEMVKDLVSVFWDEWSSADAVPKDKSYLLDKNSVLCKRLPLAKYEYQVHLKKNLHRIMKQNQREDLYNYIMRNPENCLITTACLKDYLQGVSNYGYQGYFYVKDEKSLTPIYMIAPQAIEKVIKFVKVGK